MLETPSRPSAGAVSLANGILDVMLPEPKPTKRK